MNGEIEPISRQHFQYLAKNLPRILKYELIYRQFPLHKVFVSPLKLEMLWGVEFFHYDDFDIKFGQIERAAIAKRLKLMGG